MQGQPRLMAIAAPSGEHDAYLALSFEAAGYTTLLDVRGTRFQEATVLGLALDASSMLLARMPSGQILQVTPMVSRQVGSVTWYQLYCQSCRSGCHGRDEAGAIESMQPTALQGR